VARFRFAGDLVVGGDAAAGNVGDGDGEGVDESKLSSGLYVGSAEVARFRLSGALLLGMAAGIVEEGEGEDEDEDEDEDVGVGERSGRYVGPCDVARFRLVDGFVLDGVMARLVRVGEVVRERAAGDDGLAELPWGFGGASLGFELPAMAALTTRDMRLAAGLARVEPVSGLDNDEVSKTDVLGASVVDEPLMLSSLELVDVGPCPSNVRMPLDIVPTRTSPLPGRALVGVSSIARRIDVGLGVRPTTRR
jgi:hypothetical protein